MYDRAQMKLAAKARLSKGGRWIAVLVCFLAGILGGTVSVGGSSSVNFNMNIDLPSDPSTFPSFGSGSFRDFIPFMIGFIAAYMGIAMILTSAYMIFVGNIIGVGFTGWFLRYVRGEEPPVEDLFLAFRIYGKVVGTMLLRDVYIFLWSLLFSIPGIIKSYSYYLVPYIIYENPSLSANDAITLSRKMMNGWKWEAFVLELSFLGWHILSALTCGILGILYVNPYFQTAHAMFYETVRYDALYNRCVVTPDELAVESTEYTTAPAADSVNGDAVSPETVVPSADTMAPYAVTDADDVVDDSAVSDGTPAETVVEPLFNADLPSDAEPVEPPTDSDNDTE